MDDRKPDSRKWEAIETKPTLPDPALCRTEIVKNPEATKCLVDWPIYCLYACRLGDQYFCTHKDRFEFAKRGADGKK